MKLADKFPKEISNPLVSDLKDMIGKNIETVLKVTSKKLQESRDQKKFLLMTLSDKTGSVRAVDWHNAEENDAKIKVGHVLRVRGKVVYFEDRIQLNVSKEPDSVIILSDGDYDPERFVKTSEREPEEVLKDIEKLISTLKDHDIKALLFKIFKDPNVRDSLKKAPAGLKVHHDYIGGLLEHSLSVARVCDHLSKLYNLDRDIVVAGALLHDIGKIREYKIGPSGIEITTEGELKGHIILGIEILKDFSKKVRISQERLMEIEHIIASHHGDFEYGSPVLPKTQEALVVHFIENMDAKLSRFSKIESDTEPGKDWSEFDRNLGRRIYLKKERR